jgi:hypothetical protein
MQTEARADLSLVDLTGKGLQRVGITGEVSTVPHEQTWALSRAIHEHPSQPDGLRYRLKHDLERIGVAIFDRVDVRLQVTSRGSLADPANATLLGKILQEYGKDYIQYGLGRDSISSQAASSGSMDSRAVEIPRRISGVSKPRSPRVVLR